MNKEEQRLFYKELYVEYMKIMKCFKNKAEHPRVKKALSISIKLQEHNQYSPKNNNFLSSQYLSRIKIYNDLKPITGQFFTKLQAKECSLTIIDNDPYFICYFDSKYKRFSFKAVYDITQCNNDNEEDLSLIDPLALEEVA